MMLTAMMINIGVHGCGLPCAFWYSWHGWWRGYPAFHFDIWCKIIIIVNV
jgi:hypothetical protein